jgi:peptide-methionine (S)-S-oxide reductase
MQIELATFGNGCFWCTEAVFQQIKGVIKVTSGYSGGTTENPDYKTVCSGSTGHAECLQIEFDANLVSYDQLLEVFWKTHDPTTLNRQGNDVGTQYRSIIFCQNETQHETTTAYKQQLDQSGIYPAPIVTEIEPMIIFYPAELYHQNYFNTNGDHIPYCQFVVRPKIEKFKKEFKMMLREGNAG